MARIRPASAYQRRDSKMRLIAMAYKRAIKRDLRGALGQLGQDLDAEKAGALGRAHLWGHVAHEAIRWGHFREVLKGVFDRVASCYEAGAQIGVGRINAAHRRRGTAVRFGKEKGPGGPGPVWGGMPLQDNSNASLDEFFDVGKAIGDRFNFDRFSPDTQDYLKAEQDRLIQDLEEQARSTINTVVLDAVRAGQTSDATVGTIQSVIGLTDRQAQAVLNYGRMVRELDPQALARQLRSSQYDAAYQRALEDGTALADELADEMVQAYAENYLAYRADTIAQTEAVRASNAGLQDSYQQAIDRGALPADAVRQYWKVSLDERTCEVCLSIPDQNPDGVPVGEDFESVDGPQSAPPDPHPNCLPGNAVITSCGPILAATRRWFDGNLVVVRTAHGRSLSCTPNHPVLTGRGWMPAQSVNVGDDVFGGLGNQRVLALDDHDHQDVHPTIHQVADAFARSGKVRPVKVPIAAKDFHGDGTDGEVAIIWADRLLVDGGDPSLFEPSAECDLVTGPEFSEPRRPRGRAHGLFLKAWNAALGGFVRAADLCGSLLRRHFGPPDFLGLGCAAGGDTCLQQHAPDGAAGNTKAALALQFRRTPKVQLDQSDRRSHSGHRAVGLQAGPLERVQDPAVVDAELARDLLMGKFGRVERDAVVDVSLRVFAGHVYNLETAGGFYEAEGIITHNCRCELEFVTDLDLVPDE